MQDDFIEYPILEPLPTNLRRLRGELGLSQRQMLDLLCQYSPVALDLKTYQRWERGHTRPHQNNFRLLRRVVRNEGIDRFISRHFEDLKPHAQDALDDFEFDWPDEFTDLDREIVLLSVLVMKERFTPHLWR